MVWSVSYDENDRNGGRMGEIVVEATMDAYQCKYLDVSGRARLEIVLVLWIYRWGMRSGIIVALVVVF